MTSSPQLQLNGVRVADTFTEAFPVVGARVIITAASLELARVAATEFSGYASSVIACDAEAAIERDAATNTQEAGPPPRGGNVGAYNLGWLDNGTTLVSTRRSSLVIGRFSELATQRWSERKPN